MNMKLSQIPAPALAGVIRERTVSEACAEIRNCVYDGADMIDLHISCLESSSDDALRAICSASKLPILALNYNSTFDWKKAGYTEEERIDSLVRAVKCGAAGIDLTASTFAEESKSGFVGEDKYSFTKGNPCEVVTDEGVIARQCALIDEIHGLGGEVLLSCHPGIVMDSTQVVELALFLEKRGPDIIKIVTKATCEEDLAESFKAMILLKKEVKTRVSYHANGAPGSLSRIINPILGGQIIFCVDRHSVSSTPEQLDLKTVRTVVDAMKKIR